MEPETSEGSSTLPFDFELPIWDHGTLNMPFDLPRISTDGSAFAANFSYNGHAHDDRSHISGSTSAPLTTASFDMLSSMSDSSAGGHSLPFSPLSATSSSHPAHAMLGEHLQTHTHGHSAAHGHGHDSSDGPKSATSAPGSIQSKYLALPLATAHAHRPGHARRQSHSHVQSQHDSVGRHAQMPHLTRTVSLGRGMASIAGLAGQGVENTFAAWPTGDTATTSGQGHDGLQMEGLCVSSFAALHHASYNPSPPIPDVQQQQHHYAHHLYQPSPSSGHSTYSNLAYEHNAFDAAAAAALGMGMSGLDGQNTPDHQYSMEAAMDMDLDAEGDINTDTENFHHVPYSTINPRATPLDAHPHLDGEHTNASFATDLDLDPSHAPRKPPRGPNLKRGKACGFCRQRKLRCSGDMPRCTMCTKYKRDKCEYVSPAGAGVEARQSWAGSGSSAGLSEVESRAGGAEGRIGAAVGGERARASVDLGGRSPGTGSETGSTAACSDLDFSYPYISPPMHLRSDAPATTSALDAAPFAIDQSAKGQIDVPHVHVRLEEAFAAQCPPHETHGFTTTLAPSARLGHRPPAAQQLLNTPHDLPRETSNQQQYHYTPPQPHLSPTPSYPRKHSHHHRHSFPSSSTAPFVNSFNAPPAIPSLQIPLQPHSGPSTGTSSISNSASYAHRHRLDSTEPPPPGSQVVSDPSGTLYECPPPPADVLFSSRAVYTDPVVPLTERLGEFLFFPVPNTANGVGAVRGKGGAIKQGKTVASRETESATSDELNGAEEGQGAEAVQRRRSDANCRGGAEHGHTIRRCHNGRDKGAESSDDAAQDAQVTPAGGHSESVGSGPIGAEDRIVGKIQPDDGLTDAERDAMFDTFFPYSRLFFHMSVPRFKYRLQFKDERRPSPAFLYAIYLWATRFAGQDQLELEEKYFEAGRAAMFDQSTLPYRMLDQMRAGFLLSAYVYGGGRFHEGWVLHGIATRLATSTGLHHITSSTFIETPLSETPFSIDSGPSATTSVSASVSASASPRKEAASAKDPFMRQKKYLLPPPEDRLELAERIHTFWAVFSLDRLATCLTGFPTTIPDDAITTPLPKDFDEIATGRVSARDDYTISDMYADTKLPPERQTQYCHWLKIGTLLERVSKLAFLPPESDSLYAQYKSGATPYFPDLEQARYKRPQEYTMLLAAITRLTASMGADGVLPTLRLAGDSAAVVPNLVIIIHHVRWATLTLLHDVDHADSTNQDALLYARQSVVMIRKMPQMPIHDIDSFAIQVWGVTARVFIKEVRRLTRLNQADAAQKVIEEVGVLLHEINRVGVTMVVARATAQMIQEALHIAQTG